ncbi:MAG: hypothetical protein HRF49_01960 [bacterium]
MGVRWGFIVLAVLVVIGGIGGAVWRLISGVTSVPGQMQRIVIPGEGEFHAAEPGVYTIFHEYKSFVDGKYYSSGLELYGLDVKVTGPGGEEVPVKPSQMSGNYSVGAFSGNAIFTFDAAQPGGYKISALAGNEPEDGHSDEPADGADSSGSAAAHPATVLAIGKDFTGKILGTVFGTLGLVFGGLILGAVFMLLAFLRFGRSKS